MRHAERRAERRAGWDAAWHAETSRRPRRGSKTKPVEACARDPWLDRRAAHRGGSIAIDDRDAPQLRPAASMSHLFRGPIILMNHASTRTPPGDWERSWRSVPASCAPCRASAARGRRPPLRRIRLLRRIGRLDGQGATASRESCEPCRRGPCASTVRDRWDCLLRALVGRPDRATHCAALDPSVWEDVAAAPAALSTRPPDRLTRSGCSAEMASARRPPNAGKAQIKPSSAIRSCVVRLGSAQTCRETTRLKIDRTIAIETIKGTSIWSPSRVRPAVAWGGAMQRRRLGWKATRLAGHPLRRAASIRPAMPPFLSCRCRAPTSCQGPSRAIRT